MRKLILLSTASLALALGACDSTETATDTSDATMPAEEPTTTAPATAGTIVDVAQGNPDFSTLVAAVTSADLGGTLSGAGPFTVFAPTNAAFEKIPEATRTSLMAPAGKEDLSGILTYHVVAGRVSAADLARQIEQGGGTATLTTVNGATLTARATGSAVTLTDAKGNTSTVSATDIAASNGVIHVIDTVLMP
jgi:uncharacterized surface protein with fasciclin (FAS1) repeats